MRLAWLFIASLSVAVAGCGRSAIELPSQNTPTFVRWVTPVQPYATATEVRLTVENDYAWVDKTLVERRHPVRTLSPSERQALERTLQRVRLFGLPPHEEGADPACFVPHHFFRYYDARGRQIGQLAVCFCCLGARTQPRLPFETGDADTLRVNLLEVKMLLHRMGVPTNVACSPEEVKWLDTLSGVRAKGR